MIRDEHEIDELFQSRLDQLGMTPPRKAWNALDAELERKQTAGYKKRTLRYQVLAIIFALLFILSLGWQLFKPEQQKSLAEQKPFTPLPSSGENTTLYQKAGTKTQPASSSDLNLTTPHPDHIPPAYSRAVMPKAQVVAQLKDSKSIEAPVKKMHSADFADQSVPEKSPGALSYEPGMSGQYFPSEDQPESSNQTTNLVSDPSVKGDELASASIPALKKDSLEISNPPVPEPKTGGDVKGFSVSAFFSPDFNRHRLFDNDENPAHHSIDHCRAKDYEGREGQDFSFSAGLLAKYELTQRWSLLSGLTYSSSVRKIRPSTLYAEAGSNAQAHYQLNTSLGTTELPNSGNLTPVVGDSVNLKTDSRQILHFISIPVLLRYEFCVKRLSGYVYSGLSANILIHDHSEISLPTTTTETVIVNNISGLKTLTYGFLIGVGAQYKLYKGISIFAEPVLRSSITSINQNTTVAAYPYSLGLNVGMNYHF